MPSTQFKSGSVRDSSSDDVHGDSLTYSPLSLFSRRQIEDIHLISSIWFVICLNVYREFLNKGTSIPEKQKRKNYVEGEMHHHFACL